MCSWTDNLSDLDRSLGPLWYYNSGGGARSPSGSAPVGRGFDQVGLAGYSTPNDGSYVTDDGRGNAYVNYYYHGGLSDTYPYYAYYWDEVGRLSGAVFLGRNSNQPAWENYAYGSEGNRVRQDRGTYINGVFSPSASTLFIFDMMVVKNVTYDSTRSAWSAPTSSNTDVYLAGGMARMAYDGSNTLPHAGSSQMHTFLRFDDVRGSNAFVIDGDSGEVVERINLTGRSTQTTGRPVGASTARTTSNRGTGTTQKSGLST